MPITKGLTLITPGSVAASGGTATILASGTVSLAASITYVELRNCFSSTYNDYLILWHTTTNLGTITLTFMVNTTTNTQSNAYAQTVTFSSTTVTASTAAAAAGAQVAQATTTGNANSGEIYISRPQENVHTSGWAWSPYGTNTAGQHVYFRLSVQDQYNGVRITFSGSTASGDEISLYGYNV